MSRVCYRVRRLGTARLRERWIRTSACRSFVLFDLEIVALALTCVLRRSQAPQVVYTHFSLPHVVVSGLEDPQCGDILRFNLGAICNPVHPQCAFGGLRLHSTCAVHACTPRTVRVSHPTNTELSKQFNRLTSVLSMNAAISSSVVLASRLHQDLAVFSLILFSVQVFALFPMLRRRFQVCPLNFLLHSLLTVYFTAFVPDTAGTVNGVSDCYISSPD